MKSKQLLEKLEFHESVPFAQPLLVDKDGRILRWMLKPGQHIPEHSVPNSPFYVVVVKGHGMFATKGGEEQVFGPSSLLIFNPDEVHSVRALDEELIFIGFLQGTADMRPDRTGGEMADA
ncbi:MAG: AraC family ligand binding domain-containing protein [Anaerolineae bacterium]|nr:AraC family ligand binding domain-containing protein [Anaerolineae bacterium]